MNEKQNNKLRINLVQPLEINHFSLLVLGNAFVSKNYIAKIKKSVNNLMKPSFETQLMIED